MKKVYAYAHTHWDREWYREFEEFRLRLVEVFDDILEKLENNQIPDFYFDGQTAAIEDYLKIRTQKTELVRRFIAEKRLFIGPYYCSTDSFLVDSESLIRNLQLGVQYSEKMGCHDFIAYHADTFGHSVYLPEIVKYFGIQHGIFWRGCGMLPSEFVFNGLKSVYLIQGYFQDFFSLDTDYEKKAELLQKTLDKIAAYSSDSLLLPLGADHLACPCDLVAQIQQVNKFLSGYEIVLTTPFEYLKKVSFDKKVDFELRENCRNFILPGVYSSRLDLKKYNAVLQWQLSRVVEPVCSIFYALNKAKNFQSEIDYAYKTIIKNHAHDSIYGCSVDAVHSENVTRFKKVSQVVNALKNTVLRELSDSVNISVLNLSNFPFSGAVKVRSDKKLNAQLISKSKGFNLKKIYDINQIPVTEDYTDLYEYLVFADDVAPFSMQQVSVKKHKSSLAVFSDSIENDYLKLFIKNRQISLYDKRSGMVYKNLITFIDRADIGDSYNFGALKNDKLRSAKIVSSKIIEKGPCRAALCIRLELNIPADSTVQGRLKKLIKHELELIVRLEDKSEYIEFELNWNNEAKNHILQAVFNLENPITETFSDDLTGVVKREFNPEYDIYDYIPAKRGIELKYNLAPFQKFVSVQDVGIITEGLNEYEVFNNSLRLTLLRATGVISNPQNPTRGTPAGPPLPVSDLQMLSGLSARFAVALNKKSTELKRLSEKFYNPVLAFNSDLKFDSLFSTGNENILINAVKLDPDENIIVRFVNYSNQDKTLKFTTSFSYKKIEITNAMEISQKDYEDFVMQPNSIASVKIVLV